MKQRYLSTLLASIFFAVADAGILLQGEPKVVMGESIEAIAYSTDHNFLYRLSTFEWQQDRGPQFQLELMPLDSSKPAAFTADDSQDPNYWEPLFRAFTKQLAGAEMAMDDNLKKLYVQDVQLLPGQFASYTELKEITVMSLGDFLIPDNCFASDTHLEKIDCFVAGNVSLGEKVVHPSMSFAVKTYFEQNAQAWDKYRIGNGCNYTVFLNGQPYGQTPTNVNITSAGLSLSGITDDSIHLSFPASGFAPVDVGKIKQLILNSYTLTASGIYSAAIQYRITRQGDTPSEWWEHTPAAKQNDDGAWEWSDTQEYDLLSELNPGDTYLLEFAFVGYHDQGVVLYDNGGDNYKITFTVDGATTKFADNVQIRYTRNGTEEISSDTYEYFGHVSDLMLNAITLQTKGDNEAKSVTMYYRSANASEWTPVAFALTAPKTWTTTQDIDFVALANYFDYSYCINYYIKGIASDGAEFYFGTPDNHLSFWYEVTPFTEISVDVTVNGEKQDLGNLAYGDKTFNRGNVTEYVMNKIQVSTRAASNIKSVSLRYYIQAQEDPYVNFQDWPSVPMQPSGADTWTLEVGKNLLEGLAPNKYYVIFFAAVANDGTYDYWSTEAQEYFFYGNATTAAFADRMYFDLTLNGQNVQKSFERNDKIDITGEMALTSFVLRGVSVETKSSDAKKSVALHYNLYEQGTMSTDWKVVYFVQTEADKWVAEPYIDLLEGLKPKTRYILDMQLIGTAENGQNFYFNSSPEIFSKLYFETGTLTSVDALGETGKAAVIYDMQGRRVAAPKAGIYIIDGRKVVRTR